jgi:hypothetical protein
MYGEYDSLEHIHQAKEDVRINYKNLLKNSIERWKTALNKK